MLTDVGPVELWATRWRRPSAAANPQGFCWPQRRRRRERFPNCRRLAFHARGLTMSAISDVIAANILVALFGCPRPLFSLIFGSLFVAKIKISAALDILSIDTVGVPIGSTR